MAETVFWMFMVAFAMIVSGGALVTAGDREMLGQTLMAIGAILLAGALLLLGCVMATAFEGDNHGNHGPLKEWFNGLQSMKGPCCSYADGYTVTDADWESNDGHYRVRIPRTKPANDSSYYGEMVWVDVPDDAVIKEPNRFMRTVVWPIYNAVEFGASKPVIRCFMPGSMG